VSRPSLYSRLFKAAIHTRRKILHEIADTATVLIGSHFAEPVIGKIVNDDTAYRFDTQ
jgi:hypothetical protein